MGLQEHAHLFDCSHIKLARDVLCPFLACRVVPVVHICTEQLPQSGLEQLVLHELPQIQMNGLNALQLNFKSRASLNDFGALSTILKWPTSNRIERPTSGRSSRRINQAACRLWLKTASARTKLSLAA